MFGKKISHLVRKLCRQRRGARGVSRRDRDGEIPGVLEAEACHHHIADGPGPDHADADGRCGAGCARGTFAFVWNLVRLDRCGQRGAALGGVTREGSRSQRRQGEVARERLPGSRSFQRIRFLVGAQAFGSFSGRLEAFSFGLRRSLVGNCTGIPCQVIDDCSRLNTHPSTEGGGLGKRAP